MIRLTSPIVLRHHFFEKQRIIAMLRTRMENLQIHGGHAERMRTKLSQRVWASLVASKHPKYGIHG